MTRAGMLTRLARRFAGACCCQQRTRSGPSGCACCSIFSSAGSFTGGSYVIGMSAPPQARAFSVPKTVFWNGGPPVSRAAAACCGSPVRVVVHRIDDSYNRLDYYRADVAPILEEVELAGAINIDETRSFERHVQRTALSPPKLLGHWCARPRRIRFGSQISHPHHVVKLVNFHTFGRGRAGTRVRIRSKCR